MDLDKLHEQISSMPRNPSIIKFFRYAKLSENAGYGIDKMMRWQELTGKEVSFESELTHSNVIYPLPEKGGQGKVVKNEKGGQERERWSKERREKTRY